MLRNFMAENIRELSGKSGGSCHMKIKKEIRLSVCNSKERKNGPRNFPSNNRELM